MIVEADDVEGPTLEQVVARRRLVTTRRDGACGVVAAHDVGQKTSERPTPLPLPVREGSSLFCHDFMGHIHQQIGLISTRHFTPLPLREGLGGGSGHVRLSLPLLEHLVAYRPHQDARVVAVAQDEVGEVALVPLVEEAGVVVLGLAAAPHVERLVHHDESHRVAHGQQFRGRRVVARADGVHAHRLQLHELAVQGVLAQGGTEAAEVVVLADAVQLHVLAVEPEARRSIEAEIAEARRGLYLVNDLAVANQLGTYLINIWVLARPLPRSFDACRPPVAVEPSVLDRYLAPRGVLVVHLHLAVVNIYAPVLHVNGIGAGEPYVAVDAAARVPARVGLVAVVDADSHHVAAFTDVGRDVVLEAGVAVGAVAHLLPVHIDRRVHIYAVELQEHFFLCAVTR